MTLQISKEAVFLDESPLAFRRVEPYSVPIGLRDGISSRRCKYNSSVKVYKQHATRSLAQPYQYAEWKQRRAGLDYHVEIAKHYYSVPHTLAKQKLWARITERTVEIFHKGKRVAAHMRGSGNRRHTTIAEHMPSAHRRYAGWTPARIRSRATAVGANTEILVDVIMRNRPHPEQGFRSCIGILRLAKTYGSERLEAACERALEIDATSYSSVASILKNKLERRAPRQATDGPAIDHPNIRGPQYFH